MGRLFFEDYQRGIGFRGIQLQLHPLSKGWCFGQKCDRNEEQPLPHRFIIDPLRLDSTTAFFVGSLRFVGRSELQAEM